MSRRFGYEIAPRNGHTLVVGIIARISGCQNQKELSLDGQVDHGKEEVGELHEGPVEYRVIRTRGKGESLDRPELGQVEAMLRTRQLDLLVMEDVGRLVRGAEVVRLWGVAADQGIRCIAPNDRLDTADDTWEEDLISACRDHVGHNAHTSKRLKKKLMNRFKKSQGAVALPIAGYIKPENAKTYDDWVKVESATDTIVQGLELLKTTLNCSAVADYFNSEGFPTGPYCRGKEWTGQYARCRYCGHHYVWGGNGITANLMCSNSRHWHCWNTIGFNGELAAKRIVEAISGELYKLEGFDAQFADLVKAAQQRGSSGSADRWQCLRPSGNCCKTNLRNSRSTLLSSARFSNNSCLVLRCISCDFAIAATGMYQRDIAQQLKDENPTQPAVQNAIALDRKMRELGLESPYVMVTEPPDDYGTLRRHKNPKYRFEPLDGYERALL